MDRVLQNTPATISETWYQGSTVSDPGTVTVTVTRDDGTTVTSGSASGTGANPRTFNLTAANTASLDTLTVTWTSATAGTLTTVIEVVGDFLFTLNQARSLPGLSDTTTYPDTRLADVRTTVEQALEHELGYAVVPRYRRATFGGRPRWPLRLKPFLRRIRAVSTYGTPLAQADVDALPFDENGFVWNGNYGGGYSWWVDGEYRVAPYGPVIVRYEHGLDSPPQPIRSAALDWARFLLTQDMSVDSRAERLVTDDGTLVFSAGHSGLPSVDRVLDTYRIPAIA